MVEANIKLVSCREHCSQILTGFLLLEQLGKIKLNIENCIANSSYTMTPIVFAQVEGKKIVYDVQDGYWNGMENVLKNCDYYFKRSFSEEKNRCIPANIRHKIQRLGFNYSVYCDRNPYNNINSENNLKGEIKYILGKHRPSFFTPDKFIQTEDKGKTQEPKIFFTTRLWTPNLNDQEKNEERKHINETRIKLIKELRKEYGQLFIGGLQDFGNSRKVAPELVFNKKYTERANYLKVMHDADICIGTMGLHESIGWKTAEYIAAGKAIINETFHYQVPGNFVPDRNYLEFCTIEQCLENIQYLIEHKDKMWEMKDNNLKYYREYLAPHVLIENTLKLENLL